MEQLAYFIRAPEAVIAAETFEMAVQFGTVRGDATQSLLRLMNGVYAPLITLSTAWPESIKLVLTTNMHHFLTSLTGTYLGRGDTEGDITVKITTLHGIVVWKNFLASMKVLSLPSVFLCGGLERDVEGSLHKYSIN